MQTCNLILFSFLFLKEDTMNAGDHPGTTIIMPYLRLKVIFCVIILKGQCATQK